MDVETGSLDAWVKQNGRLLEMNFSIAKFDREFVERLTDGHETV